MSPRDRIAILWFSGDGLRIIALSVLVGGMVKLKVGFL